MSIEPFSDYSRAKAMREVKALKLLQLFESGKLLIMADDNVKVTETPFGPVCGINREQFVADVEDYLNVL